MLQATGLILGLFVLVYAFCMLNSNMVIKNELVEIYII